MKKVAFFVEGETEADFIVKLISDLIPSKKTALRVTKRQGGSPGHRRYDMLMLSDVVTSQTEYLVSIYNSSADNRVNSDVMDLVPRLYQDLGYSAIVALKDLRGDINGVPLREADLPRMQTAEQLVFSSLPLPINSVIAVMEVETWFIGETNHYPNIDSHLTETLIRANAGAIGVNPYADRLEDVLEPAEILDDIYKLVRKSYGKTADKRRRTINALDMANLYVHESQRISSLGQLISIIDQIFT